jgi:ubiquinone/menaquinone biosynthesis C-methylase UbiE
MFEKAGTEQTRRFYDEEGWKTDHEAKPVDRNLFGVKENGPIRIELHSLHTGRVRRALAIAGPRLNLLECGCGGGPERAILDLCSRYTGVDFSTTGVELARSSFADVAIPHEFKVADACSLPFDDGAFDAVYCAHMIYHIEDPAAQEAALSELVRVVRPGGVVVVVAANPHPLAFPVRLVRRLAARTPIVGAVLNRFRAKPPLPYNPMPIAWMRRRLAQGGRVEVTAHRFESTAFNQNVNEVNGGGKLLWKGIRWLDTNYPRLSAYLGNYVILACQRRSEKIRVS